MPIRTLPLTLGTSSNPGRYGYDGAARLVNCLVESRDKEGRAALPIYCIDGLASLSTLSGTGGVRAMLPVGQFLYVVAGRLAYQVDISGTATVLGGIPTDGPVWMAVNRRSPSPQIAIVSDGLFWTITGGVLTEVSDSDLPPPLAVVQMDGYFIFACPRGTLYASGIDDGGSIDALDFVSTETDADDVIGLGTRGREVVAFGTRSIEFYTNTGEANFPLSRSNSTTVGCLAGKTVASIDQTLVWVADDGTVRRLDGYTGVPISNGAVNRFIDETEDKSTLSATAWTSRGHSFYSLSGPNGTWVCDLAHGNQWHERQSYGLDRWRVSCVAKLGDSLIAGHYNSPTLYTMSPDTYAEGSSPIPMTVQLLLNGFPSSAVLHRIDVDAVPGVGLADGDTEDVTPTIMLDTSEDGGLTFGGEREIGLGTINQRMTTVGATRFGLVRPTGRVIRMRMTADVVRALMAASATLERL